MAPRTPTSQVSTGSSRGSTAYRSSLGSTGSSPVWPAAVRAAWAPQYGQQPPYGQPQQYAQQGYGGSPGRYGAALSWLRAPGGRADRRPDRGVPIGIAYRLVIARHRPHSRGSSRRRPHAYSISCCLGILAGIGLGIWNRVFRQGNTGPDRRQERGARSSSSTRRPVSRSGPARRSCASSPTSSTVPASTSVPVAAVGRQEADLRTTRSTTPTSSSSDRDHPSSRSSRTDLRTLLSLRAAFGTARSTASSRRKTGSRSTGSPDVQAASGSRSTGSSPAGQQPVLPGQATVGQPGYGYGRRRRSWPSWGHRVGACDRTAWSSAYRLIAYDLLGHIAVIRSGRPDDRSGRRAAIAHARGRHPGSIGLWIWNRVFRQGNTGQSVGKSVLRIKLVDSTSPSSRSARARRSCRDFLSGIFDQPAC